MSENKKEQYRKDNDQNDFRAMLDKAAKVNTKNKEKKQEIKLSPVDTILLTQEEKKKLEFKINPQGSKVPENEKLIEPDNSDGDTDKQTKFTEE